MNNRLWQSLAKHGFLSFYNEAVQPDGAVPAAPALVREPHPQERLTQCRYTFRPEFYWLIYCPHEKLWQQACGLCKLTKKERALRGADGVKRLLRSTEREAKLRTHS